LTLAQMDHDTKAYARSKRRSTLRHSRGRGRRVPKLAEEDAAQDEGPTDADGDAGEDVAPEKEGSAGADLRELLARVENRTQVASRRYYRAWDEAKDPGKALPSAGAAETYLEIDAENLGLCLGHLELHQVLRCHRNDIPPDLQGRPVADWETDGLCDKLMRVREGRRQAEARPSPGPREAHAAPSAGQQAPGGTPSIAGVPSPAQPAAKPAAPSPQRPPTR